MSAIDLACFYFPHWHPDAHNDRWHGQGWTEYAVMDAAVPRFPGHVQPLVSSWGNFDESDPVWMAKQIDLAADHGLNAFIFDYYWYEDGPFLEGALERGFLRAPNRERLKFALMWANHPWYNWHPIRSTAKDMWSEGRLTEHQLSLAAWDRYTDRIVSYFNEPNHLRVDGRPFFSIYDPKNLLECFGGLHGARVALDMLREKTVKAGHPGVHLNLITSNGMVDERARHVALGTDSVTAYNWLNHGAMEQPGFPQGDYGAALAIAQKNWPLVQERSGVPFLTDLTVGWDSSPRCCPSDGYEARGYPWLPVWADNSPAQFGAALRAARDHLRAQPPQVPIVTINAWNEWTEGCYLLPDERWQGGHLAELKRFLDAGGFAG